MAWRTFTILSLFLIAGADTEMPLDFHKLIPAEIEQWKASAEDRVYDQRTIFDYIDGAGEVYLAYDFKRVFARRYSKEGETPIIADVFEMGSSEDAYGIFSLEREHEDTRFGQGSEYAAGLLRFWKDRYFVSILATRETASSKAAVMALGRAIDAGIPKSGRKPWLMEALPSNNLQENSVRYFHQHSSLNQQLFLSNQNILNLGKHTEGIVADYGQLPFRAHLLLVRYPSPQETKAALDGFFRNKAPEAGQSGAARLEDGRYVAATVWQQFLSVVLDAPDEQGARSLLEAVMERLKQQRKKQ